MKVTATRSVYVKTSKGEQLLNKGQSCEVDGRVYGHGHMFVKAGYLILSERPEEKPKRGRKPVAEQPEEKPGAPEGEE